MLISEILNWLNNNQGVVAVILFVLGGVGTTVWWLFTRGRETLVGGWGNQTTKRILYLFKNFKIDTITSFSTLTLVLIAYVFWQNQATLLFASIFVIFTFLIIAIYSQVMNKDSYLISLTNRDDKDDWIGRGVFEYDRVHNAYLMTNSEPGFIYSQCLNWSDYLFEFEFKIIKDCLGVIVRATNLSNYVMLQIREGGIRPHIKINGGWLSWEHQNVGLTFDKNISLDRWYKCSLFCEKDSISITIADKKATVLQRSWSMPYGRLGFPFPQKENDPQPTVIHFTADFNYGTVGFRNSGKEKALVRCCLIEKISHGKS